MYGRAAKRCGDRWDRELSGICGTKHAGLHAQIIQPGSHTNFKHCNPFFRTKNIWDRKSTNLILNPTICWKTVRLAKKSWGEKMTNCLLHRRRRWDCELLCVFSECVFECVYAVIVWLMLGVCAVLAHVRGLSNLIGDTSCLSCAPLFIIPPLRCLGKKKSANPHLSPLLLCVSVSFSH